MQRNFPNFQGNQEIPDPTKLGTQIGKPNLDVV